MPDITETSSVFTDREWRVRCIRNFFFAGVWRQVDDILVVPPHVARSLVDAGNALPVSWPTHRTDNPFALQNVTPVMSTGGGVGTINGMDGDLSILAGPNITITNAPGIITIGAPNVVPTTRQVIAGPGLSGGGPLTGNVTLSANVISVFGRTGAITAQAGDYNAGQITISPAIGTWTTVQQAITALAATPPGMWQAAASPAGAIYYTGGHVGIGTSVSLTNVLTVAAAATGTGSGITVERFSNDNAPPVYYSWKARGTQASPLPVQTNDWIMYLGWGGLASLFPAGGSDQGSIKAVVTQANGLADFIINTNDGTDTVGDGYERMRITSGGNVVINGDGTPIPTFIPGPHLQVVNAVINAYAYSDTNDVNWYSWRSRGTQASPQNVQAGDRIFHFGWGGQSSMFPTADQGSFRVEVMDAQGRADFVITTNDGTDTTGAGYERLRITAQGEFRVTGTYNGPAAHVGATAPTSPQNGQLWWDSTNLRLMIYNGTWIQAG